MEPSNTLIAHIGYPKTGTSFLQKQVFPKLPGITYHPKRTCNQLFHDLIYKDDLDYNAPATQKALEALLVNGSPNLFSLESLVGYFMVYGGLGRSQIAQRLKALGFQKIIITIRNQVDAVDSAWRQYVQEGGVLKLRPFLFPEFDQLAFFQLDYYRYSPLIKWYHSIFGAENVLVLLHEEMVQDNPQTVDGISRFIGLPTIENNKAYKKENPSLSNFSIGLLRVMNHFTYNTLRPNQLLSNSITTWKLRVLFQKVLDPYVIHFFSSKKNLLRSKPYFNRIIAHYKADNAELQELLQKDLSTYGYPLPDHP